jgi:hypothetical protein
MKKKPLSEKDTRQRLMMFATKIGAQEELKQLFNKWDRMIALASQNEKSDMSKIAILEIKSMLDIKAQAGLTINGEIIIPEQLKVRK